MREVVTLQLGQLSNYVATHFWNTQESYFTYPETKQSLVDHDVHWRAGTASGRSDILLPRTVIYDLKDGFGLLQNTNIPYGQSETDAVETALWPGKLSVHRLEHFQQEPYTQSLATDNVPKKFLDTDVRHWSDFTNTYFHPLSHNQLCSYEISSSTEPFSRFETGKELFQTLNKGQEMVDREWRPFVEECDHMQGVQVITSIDDAWGGFASSYIECLRDEYPKQCIWAWGLQSPLSTESGEKRRRRLTNIARSTSEICHQATTFIPMSLPEHPPSTIKLDCRSLWHTSALFATALETTSLQSRLLAQSGTQRVSLDEISQIINNRGSQTLAGLRMGLDFGDGISNMEEQFEIDLFGIGHKENDAKDRLKRIFGKSISSRGERLEHTKTWQPIEDSMVTRFDTMLEFPMVDTFPEIFPNAAGRDSIPVRTALFTDQSIQARMKKLRTQAASSISIEEREPLLNSLADIGDAYCEDWSSSSYDSED